MNRYAMRPLGLTLMLLLMAACSSPCRGVSVVTTGGESREYRAVVAAQLSLPSIEIRSLLGKDRWKVLKVSTGTTDDVFLFYPGTPTETKFIAQWAGAARQGEKTAIQDWAVAHAPGIPVELAACFAYRVSEGLE